MAKKGNLLSGEKALAAYHKCDLNAKMTVLQSCQLALGMNTPTQLGSAINPETLGHAISTILRAARVTVLDMTAEGALQSNQVEKIFSNALDEAMKNTSADAIASMQKLGLDNAQKMASTQKEVLGLNKGGGPVVFSSTVKMIGSNSNVMEAYKAMIGSAANNVSQSQVQKLGNVGAQSIGSAIKETALGNKPTLGARIPW